MKRLGLVVLFWSVLGLLALAAVLTIVGSALNNDPALNAGIISWLAASCLFSAWLVLWIWARTKRYTES
jgi:hypothetical protein